MIRRSISFILLAALALFCFYLAGFTLPLDNYLKQMVLKNYLDTGITNAVTAVYMDYRVFDTAIEALFLLVSVIGVGRFLRLEDAEKVYLDVSEDDGYRPSEIVSFSLKMIYPFLLFFGLYVTVFGTDTPGGGFQGGAILAAIVICHYLVDSQSRISLIKLEHYEEGAFLLLYLVFAVYFFWLYPFVPTAYRKYYFILAAIIIAWKVACGLVIIFLRFMKADEYLKEGHDV